ncbi:hypothetical protein T440DRAFT_127180 [Plenodomus tracheiphilus IPT5]|uniref:Uncharacterized protein n=1 Tax=Plenodomus tracheiphilus IPT5 TaxID=1408161 RepID=A0A6A7B1U1_9PLEO|nr:hypothetical protein T440DRAFT_127180 [Plenodomus tracheiphilus IPT5]
MAEDNVYMDAEVAWGKAEVEVQMLRRYLRIEKEKEKATEREILQLKAEARRNRAELQRVAQEAAYLCHINARAIDIFCSGEAQHQLNEVEAARQPDAPAQSE